MVVLDEREALLPVFTVQDEHLHRRGELLGLRHPVPDHAGGGQDQARLVSPAGFHLCQQVGDGLQGLAQAHVIRQDAVQSVLAQKLEPPQPSSW